MDGPERDERMEFPMARAFNDREGMRRAPDGTDPIGLRTWREVGWIFRDGQILAIERRGRQTRVRQAMI